MIRTVEELKKVQAGVQKAMQKQKARVLLCAGTGCVANGSLKIYEEFVSVLKEKSM